MGYAIDIRINEWLMPNFQPLAIFREFQPEGWVEFFHELICKEMESRRPELVRRVEWAQEVMLAEAELPFEPEFIDNLAVGCRIGFRGNSGKKTSRCLLCT